MAERAKERDNLEYPSKKDTKAKPRKRGVVTISPSIEFRTVVGNNAAQPTRSPHSTGRGLLPYFSAMAYKICSDEKRKEPRYNELKWRIAALPYSLNAVYSAYLRFTTEVRTLANKNAAMYDGPIRTYPETCFALCNISSHDDETHGRATGLDM